MLRFMPGKSGPHEMARGSSSLLSSHGRGITPQDALKKDSRGLCRGGRRETLVSLAFCRGQGSRCCTPESPVESGLASRGSKGLRSSLEPRHGSLGAL